MKPNRLIISLLCITMLTGCRSSVITRPKKEEVLSALRLANEYFMNQWRDPGQPIP